MPIVLPDVLNALLAADKKQVISRWYAPASFTRLRGLLQSTDGELSLHLGFLRDRNNRILLSGSISGEITARCQRCLGPLLLQIDLPLALVLAEQDGSADEPVAGRETYRCDPMNLALDAMVEEEILLSMSLVTMHKDDDRDCREIGQQFLAGDIQHPFADIRNLYRRG